MFFFRTFFLSVIPKKNPLHFLFSLYIYRFPVFVRSIFFALYTEEKIDLSPSDLSSRKGGKDDEKKKKMKKNQTFFFVSLSVADETALSFSAASFYISLCLSLRSPPKFLPTERVHLDFNK